MSSDFAKMLKTTLKKMQERIDDANQTYEGDQPGQGNDGAAAGAFGDEMAQGIWEFKSSTKYNGYNGNQNFISLAQNFLAFSVS